MERSRDYLPVRIGTWNKRNFLSFCALVLVCLITTLAVGVLQSQTIPYFLTKDPTGNSGTDYDILNSQCRVDEYGSAIKEANCFSHYFKIDDFFTQYFSGGWLSDEAFLARPQKQERNLQIRWVLSMLKVNPKTPRVSKSKKQSPMRSMQCKVLPLYPILRYELRGYVNWKQQWHCEACRRQDSVCLCS